jgi:hypothetical protein
MSVQDSLPLAKTIALHNGEEIRIDKLCTGDFYGVITSLQDLPKRLMDKLGTDAADFLRPGADMVAVLLGTLDKLLAVAYNETLSLVSAATKISVETLKATYPEELLDIVAAWLEVNDVAKVVERLKNVRSLLAKAGIQIKPPTQKALSSDSSSKSATS